MGTVLKKYTVFLIGEAILDLNVDLQRSFGRVISISWKMRRCWISICSEITEAWYQDRLQMLSTEDVQHWYKQFFNQEEEEALWRHCLNPTPLNLRNIKEISLVSPIVFKDPELKTLEWDILKPDYLIWVSNGHTFDLLLKLFFLGYSRKKSKTGFLI